MTPLFQKQIRNAGSIPTAFPLNLPNTSCEAWPRHHVRALFHSVFARLGAASGVRQCGVRLRAHYSASSSNDGGRSASFGIIMGLLLGIDEGKNKRGLNAFIGSHHAGQERDAG